MSVVDNIESMISPSEVDENLIVLFERVAAERPDHQALSDGEQSVSYAELNQRANVIAADLINRLGSQRGVVAILTSFGCARWIAAMGVLKAGHALVVLDPAYPADHIQHILKECAALAIVADNAMGERASRCADASPGHVELLLIANHPNLPDLPNPAVRVAPEDAAVIIFTSGSTGKSKGVTRSHRMLLHGRWLKAQSGEICESDRIAVIGSGAFAAAFAWVFYPIVSGATSMLYDFDRLGCRDLTPWLLENDATIIVAPLGVYRLWVLHIHSRISLPHMRDIYTIGMQVLRKDVLALREKVAGDWRFCIGYGMTEILTATSVRFAAGDELPCESLPAGIAIRNCQRILFLDEHRRPVGEGETGEIAIQSRYMFSGYVNAPALTAERLIDNWNGEGLRVFCTGDIGRMDSDGNLWLMGRRDDMIKVRGYRVYLGEVEAHVLGLGEVTNAAVIAKPAQDGGSDIVAFVALQGAATATPVSLRRQCATLMPHFMVPRNIHVLAELPLLPNGKPDRSALSGLDIQESMAVSSVSPCDEIEAFITRAWCDVLGRTRVSVHDHFLELGGDSFAAARLEALLVGRFGPRISFPDISTLPTVAEQAARIRAGDSAENLNGLAGGVVPITLRGANMPLFCLPAGTGSNDIWRRLAAELSQFQLFGFTLPLDGNARLAHTGFETLADALIPHLLRVQPLGPIYLIGSCHMGQLAIEIGEQLTRHGHPVGAVFIVDSPRGERPGASLKGALRWSRQALKSLVRETRIEGTGYVPRAIGAAASLVAKRWTKPIDTRITPRQRRISDQIALMARNYKPSNTALPIVLIKGAWSQIGFFYEHAGETMGWGSYLSNLRVIAIPSSHASMYEAPYVRAFARAIEAGIETSALQSVKSG